MINIIYIRLAICSVLVLLLNACIINEKYPDLIDKDTPTNNTYYFKLTVTVPKESRGAENTDEFLIGSGNESELKNAEIYFCEDNEILLQLTCNKIIENETSNNFDKIYSLSAQINNISDLTKLVGKNIQLFVIGNYDFLSHNFKSTNPSKATFEITDINSCPIGNFKTEGKILPLVNANEINIKTFSSINNKDEALNLKAIQELFEGGENEFSFYLPSVDLERTVARIDIADKSQNNNWIYSIGTSNINIKLYELQVFNVNPLSYLFRHIIKYPYDNTESLKLFGSEKTTTNDIVVTVSPNWQQRIELFNPLIYDSETHIKNGVNGENGKISITDFQYNEYSYLKGNKRFFPWRYITENTIPPSITELETNATGIAFTFQILGADNSSLEFSEEKNNYPEGISNSNSTNYGIIVKDSNGSWIEVNSNDNHYYLTYFAYIVHNDNKDPNIIGPMEFAILRNTVYQISVNSVKNLPNPKDPDSYFVNLDIHVLPWHRHDINMSW